MRTNKLSLIRKLTIAEEAINADNMKAIARKHNIFPAHIRKWKLVITELCATDQISSKKLTFNEDGEPENPGLEQQVSIG